jgi:site-specific DNA-methyltransferase (adenine-specific)
MWTLINNIRKDITPIFIFSKQPFTSFVVQSNLKMFRYELIWKKEKGVDFGNVNKKPLNIHENIIVFYKKVPKYYRNRLETSGKPYIRQNKTKNIDNHTFYSNKLLQGKTFINKGKR